jgi:oligoribonuclease (3'-5' exoribonuclease)
MEIGWTDVGSGGYILVSCVHSNGIIDDIINTAVKTAEVDSQKTNYLQHFINKQDTIVSN